jgi:L-threonylcarbamoyladenylate synthase
MATMKLKRVSRCEHIITSQETPSKMEISRATKSLRSGGIIIYPTDTLYGFGVMINNKKAIKKLYDLKKRDRKKPFSIIINNIKQAEHICGGLTSREEEFFRILLPGKITVLLKAKRKLNISGFENLEKVGFRIPESNLCHILVEKAGSPLTSSSVNISYEPNIDDTSEIAEKFAEDVDLFLDSGPVFSLKGSSVVDLTTSPPILVREGDILKEEIEQNLNIEILSSIKRRFVITFICSGNICRSPMAEGILKKLLEKSKISRQVEINSAGTLNLMPNRASSEAIKICHNHKVDINKHRSTPIDRLILDEANIIICMAVYHYNILLRNHPEYSDKIYVLKSMNREENLIDPSIADPIGMSEEFYEQIYVEIETELKRILPYLAEKIEKFLK